jgi:hypothetical protein
LYQQSNHLQLPRPTLGPPLLFVASVRFYAMKIVNYIDLCFQLTHPMHKLIV